MFIETETTESESDDWGDPEKINREELYVYVGAVAAGCIAGLLGVKDMMGEKYAAGVFELVFSAAMIYKFGKLALENMETAEETPVPFNQKPISEELAA